MSTGKRAKLMWIRVAGILWILLGLVYLLPALIGAFFIYIAWEKMESPLLDLGIWFSFPIISIGSSIGMWILKAKYENWAFLLSLLPVLPACAVILFFFKWWTG